MRVAYNAKHFSLFQSCCAKVENTASSFQDIGANKRIMLVSEFYYGRYEGDGMKEAQKTNNTFKCQSCLKVLKNNIRYGNVFLLHLKITLKSA